MWYLWIVNYWNTYWERSIISITVLHDEFSDEFYVSLSSALTTFSMKVFSMNIVMADDKKYKIDY